MDVKKYFATDDSRVDTGDAKIEDLMPEPESEDVKAAVSDKLSQEEAHQGNRNRNRNRNQNRSNQNKQNSCVRKTKERRQHGTEACGTEAFRRGSGR